MTELIVRFAVVGVTALALAGCGTPSTTSTPTVIPTPTATASPTPLYTDAQQAAVDTVLKFYEVENQIATNDEVPLDALYTVAGGNLAQERLKSLQSLRGRGWTQQGAAIAEVRSVSGEGAPFVLDVCVDTADVDILDATGTSVVAEGNPTLMLHRFVVSQVGDGLRATDAEAVSTPC